MTKLRLQSWYCANTFCRKKATWKISQGTKSFITVCDKCVRIPRQIGGFEITRLPPNERVPFGWTRIRQDYTTVGAKFDRMTRTVNYGKR